MAQALRDRAAHPERQLRTRWSLMKVLLPLLVVAPPQAHAHTFKLLYAFKGGADGSEPAGNMAMDASGNLYGTTISGGGGANCSAGCGTVFKLDAKRNETVLYSFSGQADGQYPLGVILDPAGNIYGTTVWGGNPNCQGWGSCGVIYRLNPAGKLTILHTFQGNTDGMNPEAPPVIDAAGNLYGTTLAGGGGGGCIENNPPGCGVVYKVDQDGNETVLHAFAGTDGANSAAGLLLDMPENLYGSTTEGGRYNYGTIFRLGKSGKETVLHDFTGEAPDGGVPYDGLTLDRFGNLYGTTEYHPSGSTIFGTVFKLARKGNAMTELYSFDLCDGGYPLAGVLRDPKGNLLGTTASGGHNRSGRCVGQGTIFELDKGGTKTTLATLGGKKGAAPGSIPVQDQFGNLYGTAAGGPGHQGLVFEITP